jgi:hypothetical protein
MLRFTIKTKLKQDVEQPYKLYNCIEARAEFFCRITAGKWERRVSVVKFSGFWGWKTRNQSILLIEDCNFSQKIFIGTYLSFIISLFSILQGLVAEYFGEGMKSTSPSTSTTSFQKFLFL